MGEDVFTDPLFGQAAELELLAALRPHVRNVAAIDVGAERGDVTATLLEAGWGPLTMIEASPRSATALAERFAGMDAVKLLHLAAVERDGAVTIREARTDGGEAAPQFDSVVAAGGGELEFLDAIEVEGRSLGSLATAGEIEIEPGLLKVDVEGLEASVLRGAVGLRPELVMVEHWLDLPGSHGACPWSFDELAAIVAPLGLSRWAAFTHGDLHTRISVDEGGPEVGEWANIVFFAEPLAGAVEAALPEIRGRLEARLLAKAEAYRQVADERLVAMGELERAADERAVALERASELAQRRGKENQELRAKPWRLLRRR